MLTTKSLSNRFSHPDTIHPHPESAAAMSTTQSKRSKNVLIIEDEQDVIDLLALHLLKDESFTISTATNGLTGLQKARTESPWLIILDLMLPKMSGLEICKILKGDAATRKIPIIMLTAKTSESDRIIGLELGADDYITKPFSPREVMLRIKGMERRRTDESVDEKLTTGLISVDPVRHRVEVGGKPVRLTTAEFNLLMMLMKKPGRVLSRDILLSGAWGYESAINTRTVDTHIRRLRHKLGKAAKFVETVRGFGYRLSQE